MYISKSKKDTIADLINKSNSYDGYVREKAVHQLGLNGDSTAIPELLIRVNDWVYEVREAAKNSLDKLLVYENSQAFVMNLPNIYKLQEYKRENHTSLILKIVNFLLQAENNKYLIEAIDSENTFVARISCKLCLEHNLISKEELLEKSFSSSDVVIKALASELLSKFDDHSLEYFLNKAINDKYMPLRREAFQIYLRKYPKIGLTIANDFLFDKHYAIREIAIKYLQENNTNIEKILSDVLIANTDSILKLRCSIYGLAQINSKKSIAIIERFMDHKMPSIRKACIQSLSSLLGEASKEYLLVGLRDKSPNVAKETSRIINKLKIEMEIADILEVCEKFIYTHTIPVCLNSIQNINKWNRLILLLRLFTSPIIENSRKQGVLEDEVRMWNLKFNKTAVQPTSTQISQIISQYDKGGKLFTKYVSQSIEFTIRTFK